MTSAIARRILSTRIIFNYPNVSSCSCVNILCRRTFYENRQVVPRFNWPSTTTSRFTQYPGLAPFSTSNGKVGKQCEEEEPTKKLTLFQKFKQMYKDYWYVLVPVHLVTSAAWFGGFYYMAKRGIDIVAILESLHVSSKVVDRLKDSSMGYIAVAYALYKIATPARYTVTLGGTTISINYLKKWGYIKPVPSKEKMKQILQEKKETISKSMKETKEGIIETKESLMESIHEKKEDIKEKKESFIKSVSDFTEKRNLQKKKSDLKKKEEYYKDKS